MQISVSVEDVRLTWMNQVPEIIYNQSIRNSKNCFKLKLKLRTIQIIIFLIIANQIMARLSNLYLFIYNFLQTIGWAIAFWRILIDFSTTHSFNAAFASSGQLICLLQKAAFLEVIHGALGLVPSGVLLPLMQWGGRTHYLLALVGNIVEVQESQSIFVTFVAWSISEVIRYSNYALSCIGKCPYWSTYIRYTLFIPVYPVGVAGEMWLMYQALPFIKEKDLYRNFFAALPFSYLSFVKVVLVCYPFLWLKLYLHLLKQRRSKLRKPRQTKKE